MMIKKYNQFENFQHFCHYTFFYIFSGILLMALFQVAVIIAYGDLELFQNFSKILRSFWFAARGSGKIFAVIMSPFFLCGLFFYLLPFSNLQKFIHRTITILGFWFFAMSFLISLINFYYYRFYGAPIDIFIFEAQKESLKDLYYYIQGGVSLFWAFCILGVGLFLLFWLNRKLVTLSRFQWKIKRASVKIAYAVISFLLFFIIARGAIHPSIVFKFLRDEKVTNSILLNNAATNGITALYGAYTHKKLQQKQWKNFSPVSEQQALAAYKTLYSNQEVNIKTLKQKLYKTTSELPSTTKKPHIALVLMESWGSYQMRFHHTTNLNLLGELEPHLKADFYFENLFAIAGHTYASIQFLFSNFWGFNLVDANYQGAFKSNVSLIQKLGYKTIFITSGRKNWHKMEKYAKQFGFDDIYDWYDIIEKYPDAPANFYGGFDHTMFDFAYEKLQVENEKPLFLFLLTTSNHTPYFIPPRYQPQTIEKIPPKMQKVIVTNEAKIRKILTAYQYANHSLGEFITKIKADPKLKENIVISAVGDHYSRSLFNQSKNESVLYGYNLVPAYFYFPQNYRKNLFFDPQRFGKQGDLFPTLFENLFSQVSYFASGNNLFSRTYPRNLAISESSVMSESGYVTGNNYYRWKNNPLGDLQRLEQPTEALLHSMKIQKAYNQLLNWHFFQK